MPATGPTLARRLGLGHLALYGLGDILGAGIYVLVGKVIGLAGVSAWVSFILSGALALVTGLTYAELASRVPRSAGAAAFCAHAFRAPLIPFLVGMLVLASGVTSTATVSLAFHGYLKVLWEVPQLAAAIGLILLMSFLSFWGIRESAWTNNLFTALEITGLLLVIGVGGGFAMRQDWGNLLSRVVPSTELLPILSGATLAFYAFIGFEDLANLAEEAKNPTRDIPRAILIAVGVSSLLYLSVIFIVLWTLSPSEAASSTTPLLDVLKRAGFPLPSWGFAPIALIAVCNTGLANCIMASRLLYGMADENLLPGSLARIHPARRTPWVAVLSTLALCVLLVATGGVSAMAQTTSLLLVIVFTLVHASLILLRKRDPSPPGVFRVPGAIPYVGIAIGMGLFTRFPLEAYIRTLLVLGVGLALYFGSRRKR